MERFEFQDNIGTSLASEVQMAANELQRCSMRALLSRENLLQSCRALTQREVWRCSGTNKKPVSPLETDSTM